MKYIIYSDGGARGNPGPAGCGFVIYDQSHSMLYEGSQYIGETTNNQAEYQALFLALTHLKSMCLTSDQMKAEKVDCFLDSELVVKQLNREYKMKNLDLRVWFDKINKCNFEFGNVVSFHHIPRSENKRADELANEAMDKG